MDVTLPDGSVIRGVPDGTTKAQLAAKLKANGYDVSKLGPVEEPTLGQQAKQAAGNVLAGAVRGAGSIGATLLYPIDKATDIIKGDRGPNVTGLVTGKQPLSRNEQRRADMDAALADMGAETDSIGYGVSKVGTEIVGTLGVGGGLAGGFAGSLPTVAKVAPGVANALQRFQGLGGTALATKAPELVNAIRTAGMQGGNVFTRAAGGAITGGASAGLVNPEDAYKGALVGGALPGITKVAGVAGNKVGTALRSAVPDEVKALAIRAKELGIDVPVDRLMSSKPMDAIASGLNYVPFSGRAATESKMSEQLNRAASKLMGQDTPNINKAVRDASVKLGGEFDRVLKNTGVAFDKQLLDDVSRVFNTAEKELGSDSLRPIAAQIDELTAKGGTGTIDGQAAYNIKRTLDRIGNSNRPEAWHALELKGVLMDALNRSLGQEGAAAFKATRQQYGNMLALEKLAKNGVEGEISVARLANLKNINNEPLQELADIAAQFVKAREGQHGAMQRAVVGGTAALTAGLPGLATGAAIGRGTNAALNSNALRNVMLGQSQPNAISALLARPEVAQLGYRAAPGLAANR